MEAARRPLQHARRNSRCCSAVTRGRKSRADAFDSVMDRGMNGRGAVHFYDVYRITAKSQVREQANCGLRGHCTPIRGYFFNFLLPSLYLYLYHRRAAPATTHTQHTQVVAASSARRPAPRCPMRFQHVRDRRPP